ncbi:MAG TPA: hypothetical protein VFI52_04455, partial [Gemmatimonadaceae bacterium]|nr:hypothetical protein [Gemmatimonadaceae bacterium]
VSPRLGFTWYLGGSPGRGYRFTSYGTQSLAPTMMLRGGIGEFRNLLPSTLLADASVANGLPGGVSRLSCIGAAAPVPQWNDYLTDPATLPTTCAGGAPPIFTDASPTVRAFDRSYGAPRSWRGNLAAVKEVGPFSVMVDGVYSLNLDQAGIVDRNFSGAPQFTLAEEGNRPVFVAPSSISATSGAVSPVEARVDRTFGRVITSVSDLRSTSRQVTATLSPKGYGKIYYSLAYTLGGISARSRGFDGGTFASPLEMQRAPGDFDVRHQVIASLGTDRLPRGMNIALYARFSSGLPYTPRINGDVNGDGLGNDRAFVFDPARVGDAKVASDMRALLAGAPSGARECLMAQLGRAAEQNSCRGPWTSMINARIGIYNRFGFTRRQFHAVLHLTNPAGGLDQLLHGSNGLHGWGGGALPDPTLLTVRGFDPTAKRFQYEVNPRFGSTESTRRIAAVPFRITLDLSFDLGEPMMKQLAGRLMNPGRRGHAGPRMDVDSMVAKLRRNVTDPYEAILDESDSLLVTRDQSDSLKKEQIRYKAHVDSTWRAALAPLVAMGDDYDGNVAMHIIDDATEKAWLAARDEVLVLERILSPLQMRLAPFPIPWLVQAKGKSTVGIRMMTF